MLLLGSEPFVSTNPYLLPRRDNPIEIRTIVGNRGPVG